VADRRAWDDVGAAGVPSFSRFSPVSSRYLKEFCSRFAPGYVRVSKPVTNGPSPNLSRSSGLAVLPGRWSGRGMLGGPGR
jgi:hypothetical protein